MDESQLTLKDLGRYAESLLELVIEQSDKLQDRLGVQDGQIKRIWDAYTSIGITDPMYAMRLLDPIRAEILETADEAPYWKKYRQINGELDRLLGHLKDHDNQLEVLKKTEKVIVDLLILLNFQWELLVAQLKSVCDQIQVSRDTERAEVAKYRALEPTLKGRPSEKSVTKAFAIEQQRLILEQIELFGTEQSVLDQMEFVCNERDRIFPISSGLFLK